MSAPPGRDETTEKSGDSDKISSYYIYTSCFFRRDVGQANSAKCLLLWHHFLCKSMIIRIFS